MTTNTELQTITAQTLHDLINARADQQAAEMMVEMIYSSALQLHWITEKMLGTLASITRTVDRAVADLTDNLNVNELGIFHQDTADVNRLCALRVREVQNLRQFRALLKSMYGVEVSFEALVGLVTK